MKRFWDKVDIKADHDCWEWTAAKSKLGYGVLNYRGKRSFFAHRIVWILTHGDIPEGMNVLHECDNRKCVNPSHLFLGTHRENMHDRDIKGRGSFLAGERHPRAKLSSAQVLEIKNKYTSRGAKQSQLARDYGVSVMQINRVVRCVSRASG